MSIGDLWNRTLVYFGIAEEDDEFYDDDDSYAAEESLEQSYRERPNVRRLTPRRRGHDYDDWTESEADRPAARAAARSAARVRDMRPQIEAVCRLAGYEPPLICTPEELPAGGRDDE